MKARDYCCCAIPIINAGIYSVLIEQSTLAFLVGTLSVATPHIVGASTPSLAPWVLAIICYVAVGIQVLGFIGVARERPLMYRRYVQLHILITLAAFSVAAVWIAVSGTRHSNAKSRCITDFYSDQSTSNTSEGDELCNIFPWVDIGIMGGMWLFFALTQTYFYTVLTSYGTSQRRDHKRYSQVYDPARPLNTDIPMTNRGDSPSDPIPQATALRYGHVRQDSEGSVSTILGDKVQKPQDGFSDGGYGFTQAPYPSQSSELSHPSHAYTQEPGPTPTYNDDYYSGGGNPYVDRPNPSQSHPAEGSFHRKAPRMAKPDTNDYGDGRYR